MSALAALHAFHFLRPAALLLLLALPLAALWWRAERSDAGNWRKVVDAHLLPHLIERIDGGARRSGWVIGALVWTIGCVALAGPAWEREVMPLYRNQAARVIALELAPTMLAQDEKPSRLEHARFKIDDILKRSRDYQTALIGYAGDAFVAAPLTDDVATVRNLVDSLDPSTMPVTGNDTGRAIDSAADLIEQAGLHHGEIIVIADSVSDDALPAARRAKAKGLEVSVLGVGNTAGAPVPLAPGGFLKDDSGNMLVARLDPAAMRAVADAGGGTYAAPSADAGDIDALLHDDVDTAARNDAVAAGDGAGDGSDNAAASARWRDRGPWLLLLLVPFALLGFRRGCLMVFAIALVAPAAPTRAASLQDLWQRTDQQAAAALAKGDAKQAASIATTPEWQASAAYRNGDYKKAAEDYARTGNADGAYNRGNALAKSARYKDAIAAYDEALKRDPGMADAKANRDSVEKFLKQQQQKKQQQNSHGKDGKKSDQDKSGGQKKPGDDSSQKGDGKDQPDKDSSKDGKSGEDKQGQQQDSPAAGADSKDKKKDGEDGKPGQQKDSGDASKPSQGGAGDKPSDKAAEQARADQQQRDALSKDVDKALAAKPKPGDEKGKSQAQVPVEDEATREKQQALEHWLQRVPDDPGGLLRRKFQLEYQRRQQGTGDSP